MTTLDPRAKLSFIDSCKEHLFAKSKVELLIMLRDMIVENSNSLKNDSEFMGYNGRVFSMQLTNRERGKPHNRHRRSTSNRPYVAPINVMKMDLRDRMDEYLQEEKYIENAEAVASTYLVRVLNTTDRLSDLYELLPESLAPVLKKHEEQFSDEEGRYTPTEIAEFLQQNEQHIKHLKARMLHNLISR